MLSCLQICSILKRIVNSCPWFNNDQAKIVTAIARINDYLLSNSQLSLELQVVLSYLIAADYFISRLHLESVRAVHDLMTKLSLGIGNNSQANFALHYFRSYCVRAFTYNSKEPGPDRRERSHICWHAIPSLGGSPLNDLERAEKKRGQTNGMDHNAAVRVRSPLFIGAVRLTWRILFDEVNGMICSEQHFCSDA